MLHAERSPLSGTLKLPPCAFVDFDRLPAPLWNHPESHPSLPLLCGLLVRTVFNHLITQTSCRSNADRHLGIIKSGPSPAV